MNQAFAISKLKEIDRTVLFDITTQKQFKSLETKKAELRFTLHVHDIEGNYQIGSPFIQITLTRNLDKTEPNYVVELQLTDDIWLNDNIGQIYLYDFNMFEFNKDLTGIQVQEFETLQEAEAAFDKLFTRNYNLKHAIGRTIKRQ